MNLFRRILRGYRAVQFKIYRRNTRGVLKSGIPCRVNPSIENGDVVHPCVRHLEKPFRGHTWWMVYTPYFKSDAKVENPLLCYGISNTNEIPTEWEIETEIERYHNIGYNSDPFLQFANDNLMIYWRENMTPELTIRNLNHGTFVRQYNNKGELSEKELVLFEEANYEDKEVSPAFFKKENNQFALGMHLVFYNKSIQKFRSTFIGKFINKLTSILDLMGFYSQQESLGVALWNKEDGQYKYIKTVKIENCNKLYRPWHFDLFTHDNNVYMLIQTNQCNADICLAKMSKIGQFILYSKPLLTGKDINMTGIYKPTGGVKDGIFYLYYTAQDFDNRSLNKLFVTTMPFDELIKIIDK